MKRKAVSCKITLKNEYKCNEVSERELCWRGAENIKEIIYDYTQYPIYENNLCPLTGKQLKKMWHIFTKNIIQPLKKIKKFSLL